MYPPWWRSLGRALAPGLAPSRPASSGSRRLPIPAALRLADPLGDARIAGPDLAGPRGSSWATPVDAGPRRFNSYRHGLRTPEVLPNGAGRPHRRKGRTP